MVTICVAPGAPALWSNPADWSLMHVPSSVEIATFDFHSSVNAVVDSAASTPIGGLSLTTTYVGALDVERNLTINGNYVQANGTVTLNSFTSRSTATSFRRAASSTVAQAVL